MISLAHICLYVQDLELTLDFYSEVLGFEKVFDFTYKGELYGYYLKIGEKQFLECFKADSDIRGNRSPVAHLCLETDDIDGEKQNLEKHGISVTEKKLGKDNTYQIWFKDPDGIDIEFHQYTEESSQFNGDPVEVDWL